MVMGRSLTGMQVVTTPADVKVVNLFVGRHGETQANREKWIMSHLDVPLLDPDGYIGAELLAEELCHHPYFEQGTIIFSSPLSRCSESAKPLARKLGCEVVVRAPLIERNFGALSGKSWKELEDLYPGFKYRDINLLYDYRPHGGESVDEVKERIKEELFYIHNFCSKNKFSTAVIYCHFGILGMITNLATGECLEPKNLQFKFFQLSLKNDQAKVVLVS